MRRRLTTRSLALVPVGVLVAAIMGAASPPAVASGSAGTSPSPHRAAARAAAVPAGAITFSEFEVGTSISKQYQDRGVLFGGDDPYITTDDSNPTSPVLTGSPKFFGEITFRIVDPVTHRFTTTNGVTLDVGYIDNPNSIELDYFDADGTQLGNVRANAEGINTVTIPANGIARVAVHAVLDEPSGFAIDNVVIGTNTVSRTVHRMVALGDSYSSGEGLLPDSKYVYDCGTDMSYGTYFKNTTVGYTYNVTQKTCDTVTRGAVPRDYFLRPLKIYHNKCHRTGSAWPWRISGMLGVSPTDTLFVACSNATTANVGYLDSGNDIANAAQFSKSPDGVAGRQTQADDAAAFAAAGGDPDLVTVGVGGNDEGFASIVQTCLAFFCDAFPFQNLQPDAIKRVSDTVYPRVRSTLANIKNAFPDATILTYGYPSVLDPSKTCAGNLGLDKQEKTWAENTLLPALNQAIADAAASVGVTFMPIDGVTRGHEICSKDPWINGLRGGNDVGLAFAAESFHPNQSGHQAIAEYFKSHYTDGNGHLTFANPPAAPTIPVFGGPVGTIVGAVQGSPVGTVNCGASCLQPACGPSTCQLQVQLTGFSPNTTVGVTLHSDPVTLGSVTTDADGNASSSFAVPPSVPDGVHTLEITGTDASGVQQIGTSDVSVSRVTLPRADPYPDLVPVQPQRLLDTRPSSRVGYTGAKPEPGSTVRLTVAGVAPVNVPAGVRSVVLTVTAVNTTGPGYVTAWPCGAPRPLASNVNLRTGVIVPNQVTVPLGTNGQVCLYTSAGTDLIADVSGYYPSTSYLRASTPERLLDTRPGSIRKGYSGTRPGPGRTVVLQVGGAGAAKVPNTAKAVVLNVTGVNAVHAGYVTVFGCQATRPLASNLNLRPGVVSSNQVTAPLDASGRVCLYTSGGTDLVADLAGYLTKDSRFAIGAPSRLLDTRPGSLQTGYSGSRPAAGAVVTLKVAGRGTPAVPATASAVVLNVTGLNGGGYVTAWPCGTPRPLSSNLNLAAGAVAANQVTVGVGTGGNVCLYTSAGADLVADLTGYFPGGR